MGNDIYACNECPGMIKCNKYCTLKLGENIVKFVNNMDSVKTNIGELKIDKQTNKKSLIVSGIMLEKFGAPIDCLSTAEDMQMSITSKLSNFEDITPTQMLLAYTNYRGIQSGVQNKAIEDLKTFCGNRILPTPIKPDTIVEVKNDKGNWESTFADYVKWKIDKESGELIGSIMAKKKGIVADTHVTIPMREYGITWTMPNIEKGVKITDDIRKVIRMSDIGLISPINITDGTNEFGLDGSYLYIISNNTIYIAGEWGSNNRLVENEEYLQNLRDTKAYKKIKSIESFVERHKRFIVPYGLCKPTIVKVK